MPQKRSVVTRQKILDGLEALLATAEFEDISIAQLAREAGVAVGSVYSHFKDKDALLPALFDRQLERIQRRLTEFTGSGTAVGSAQNEEAGLDLRSTINVAIRGALNEIDQTLGVRRALLTYRRQNPNAEVSLLKTLHHQALEALTKDLELHRGEIAHEDIREPARVVNYFVSIVFLDRIVFANAGEREHIRPSDEALIQIYTDMVYRYLTAG